MKATKILPAGYIAHGKISMKDKGVLLLLNLLGVPWFVLCIIIFVAMATMLRPLLPTSSLEFSVTLPEVLVGCLIVVGTFIVTLVLHEMVHGILYSLFTRSMPTFRFKGVYAYAAMPGWYIPRPQLFVVGLAPLVLLSVAGLLLVPFVSFPYVPVVILAMILNATGAIGDLYIVVRLALVPRGVLVEDWGDGMNWYVPGERAAVLSGKTAKVGETDGC